jgi:predicted ATP-dependent endonuclease of OLD family
VAVLDRVSIHGYRGARDVELEPAAVCVLVGESSSGKSTVLAAVWTLLEAAAFTSRRTPAAARCSSIRSHRGR